MPRVLLSVVCQTSLHNLWGLSTLHNQRFPESKFRNARTGTDPRLNLGLQRLPHPSWARESAGRMIGEVPSSIFVTLGCGQLSQSCHFARPQSESAFVFVCLCLCHWGVVSCLGAATSLVLSVRKSRVFVQKDRPADVQPAQKEKPDLQCVGRKTHVLVQRWSGIY